MDYIIPALDCPDLQAEIDEAARTEPAFRIERGSWPAPDRIVRSDGRSWMIPTDLADALEKTLAAAPHLKSGITTEKGLDRLVQAAFDEGRVYEQHGDLTAEKFAAEDATKAARAAVLTFQAEF